jgi:hypothetical protein
MFFPSIALHISIMELPKEPDLLNKVKNLSTSVANWAVQDKFAKVTDEQFSRRKEICVACPYWKPEGYNNLGACGRCGCSVMKLYIPSANCPDNPPRWTAITSS